MTVLVDTKVLTTEDGQNEDWFPCNVDGKDVRPSAAAIQYACRVLNCDESDLQWHTPDVFETRYGSNYMATATYTATGNSVRFVDDLGEFKEGDDK